MQLEDAFLAAVLAVLVILAGKQIRNRITIFRKVYVPSTLIGGVLALALGPQVLGAIVGLLGGGETILADGVWPERVLELWSEAPGLLISVVFAGLFLGKKLHGPRTIWRRAGPMVAHGQTLAWGQYVVGLLLTVLVLVPVWDTSPLAGAVIEIGFEGGHGTAAGLSSTFRELGFENGADLALGLATVGLVVGVLLGTAIMNWGIARGHIPKPDKDAAEEHEVEGDDAGEGRAPARLRDRATDPLSLHLGLIGAAVALGWLMLEGLKHFESALLIPLGWPELMTHVPLFPLAMIGGVIIQMLANRIGVGDRIERRLVTRISGVSLDVLIVAAMATLSLAALGAHFWPFVLLCAAGIAWNVSCLLLLAPRIFKKDWLQYGLADFGQSMGMTVLGLLLLRMSDPKNKTGAVDAFGYKQLLFEPIVGGGLFTAFSMPLIASFGPIPVLIGVSVITAGWIVVGLKRIGMTGPQDEPDEH